MMKKIKVDLKNYADKFFKKTQFLKKKKAVVKEKDSSINPSEKRDVSKKGVKGKYFIAAVIVILVFAAGLWVKKGIDKKKEIKSVEEAALSSQQQMQAQAQAKEIQVKVAPVKKEKFEDILPAMGSIRGYIEVDLKFGINGSIEKFSFNNGDKVEKGEVIATLDQGDAMVKYQYAELKLEEYEKLYEIGALTESKLKQVELEKELARLELEKTFLRAPFNGVINNREAETGKFVTINDRIATFSSIDEVVAEVGIIEKDIDKVRVGQKAIIKVDAYPNIEFVGIVDNISSSFEGKSRTLSVRIKMPNPKVLLLPGMFARVMIYIYEKEDALVIPLLALDKKEGEYQVFVAGADSKAELRKVEIDYLASEEAVVNSGVEENESVIIEKSGELENGSTIKIMEE